MPVFERLKRFQRLLKARARLHIAPYINDFRYGRTPVAMVTGSVGKTSVKEALFAALDRAAEHLLLEGLRGADELLPFARSVIRRPPQLGQNPRPLHENTTSRST